MQVFRVGKSWIVIGERYVVDGLGTPHMILLNHEMILMALLLVVDF